DGALVTAAKTDPALTKAVSDLEIAAKKVVDPFFARYPALKPLLDSYVAAPPTDSPEKKRTALLAGILPELKRLRKREQALAAVSAAARVELEFATAILDDPDVLNAAANTALTGLDDFMVFETIPDAKITGAFEGFIEASENALYDFAIDAD